MNGVVHARCAGHLYAVHLHARADVLCGIRNAGDEAAAAHRHHNGIDVVKVIQNLQRDGALARDNVFVVKRVHERVALFFFQFNRLVIRVVVNALHKANLCAVALCGLHLRDRCGVRQTDERFDAVFRCRQRHALCVVARGTGNNAFRFLFCGKLGDLIRRAAHLKRAGDLQILGL